MLYERDPGLTVPIAAVLPLAAGGLLVGVRGEVRPEVVALALALVVVVGGRIGGRPGGVAAALMATATFDFFHTQPYLSLKIARTNDLWTALVLLAVGLAVGDLSGRVASERTRLRGRNVGSESLSRVVDVAAGGCAEDVELSVRAELLELLSLQDCWFTTGPVELPLMDMKGRVDVPYVYQKPGGFELPQAGFALPVPWRGRTLGYLAATPVPSVGISVERRRVAVVMAEVLGLALAAEPAAT